MSKTRKLPHDLPGRSGQTPPKRAELAGAVVSQAKRMNVGRVDLREPTCRVVRAGAEFLGKQGHLLAPGISARSVGARGIHLQIATISPGGRAKAHKHANHETAIYVLSGDSGMWYGEKLERHIIARSGDFLYIPANVPHLPYNPSKTVSCVALIARTDPDEQESVVFLPELDAAHASLLRSPKHRQDDIVP